MRPSVRSGDA